MLDKRVGETPLVAIDKWKRQNSKYAGMQASYAGRLDPMASGKLLVLFGDECKRQKKYTGLDKEYEIEILLDVGSDTGDVLGLTEYANIESSPSLELIKNSISKELGLHEVEYPKFSSKTVDGRPLFLHTLEGSIDAIKIPMHKENYYKIKILNVYQISSENLARRIKTSLDLTPSTNQESKRIGENFRIDVVRAGWKMLFKNTADRNYTVLRLKITCGSGAYMRTLVNRIGKSLGTKALALSIKRTKIGKFMPLWRGQGIWIKEL